LYRILRNVWADRFRKTRLEIPLPDDGGGAVEPYYDWGERFLAEEFSQEVEQALSELPEEYRWAVLLADVEEFSYQEIAGIMQCPIGTVMSRINRGRRMLARLIRAEAENNPRTGRKSRESQEKL
jgi:RNA polymerase sigma-70 factor (ECF subfamily)